MQIILLYQWLWQNKTGWLGSNPTICSLNIRTKDSGLLLWYARLFVFDISTIKTVLLYTRFYTWFITQPVLGVIGNIVFPSSRNKGKIIIWGRVHPESASSPVITDKWRQECLTEPIAKDHLIRQPYSIPSFQRPWI